MGAIAVDPKEIEGKVVEAIETCHDPEIPVDIYELGLIYGVAVDPSGSVEVTMTLTSPNCPSAVELPGQVEAKVRSVPGRDGRPGRGRLRPTVGAVPDERGRSASAGDAVIAMASPRNPMPMPAVNPAHRQPQVAVVQTDCTGCNTCVDYCLVDCIEPAPPNRDPRSPVPISIREDECIGCFVCAKVCEGWP